MDGAGDGAGDENRAHVLSLEVHERPTRELQLSRKPLASGAHGRVAKFPLSPPRCEVRVA